MATTAGVLLGVVVLSVWAPAYAPVRLPAPGPAAPAPRDPVDPPTGDVPARNGPAGRLLLDGTWLFRRDPADHGVKRRWFRGAATGGWRRVRVPYAFNAHDDSVRSMLGSVAWYRRDFRLPAAPVGTTWNVRFETVNHRAVVWLNGRIIGRHVGPYAPFELALAGLRQGVNRLVVRADNRRVATDFPPPPPRPTSKRASGWWNDGGILREVVVRPVRVVDLRRVTVLPALRCARCAAPVRVEALVRNVAARRITVRLRGRFGALPFRFERVVLAPGAWRLVVARLRVAHPVLWSPSHPFLYPVSVLARAGVAGSRGRDRARFDVRAGIRTISVSRGRLLLNGRAIRVRGVGLHEQTRRRGGALQPSDLRELVSRARSLGATAIRSHYPLSPYLLELADESGLLVWSEVPVYRPRTGVLDRAGVRRAAVAMLRRAVEQNAGHPSIFVWSVGNELGTATGGQRQYLAAAASAVRAADPTRPVGLAFAGDPRARCTPAYAPIDVLGVNEYFGWYGGPTADRHRLGPYLDMLQRCYADKALVVSEFGAEANRRGRAGEKGTYEFQRRLIDYNFRVFATRPWLDGALYWALQAFRAAPRWAGGNPRPNPPWHEKGLLLASGAPKPAFEDVRRAFALPWAQLGTAGSRTPAGAQDPRHP